MGCCVAIRNLYNIIFLQTKTYIVIWNKESRN